MDKAESRVYGVRLKLPKLIEYILRIAKSKVGELFEFLPAVGDEALNAEGELENMLSGELAFATEHCAVCVVDDECLIPVSPGVVSGKTLAANEAHRIYNDCARKRDMPIVDLPEINAQAGPLKEIHADI